MKIKHVIAIVALGILGTSCSDDNETIKLPEGDYANGILIANEGPFGNGTGTISFLQNDSTSVQASIYNAVNNEDLGNIVQSIAFTSDKAFIIANVSNKISVVDRYSFIKEASIDAGLSNPRYMVVSNGKGYVTNWGDTADETDDYIAIINLESNTVEGTIPVVLGPEAIVAKDNYVFVAHQGAFGTNNKVSVIDTDKQEVITTITVGDRPGNMQLDDSGDLWVLSSGEPSYATVETSGTLSKINTSTYEVENSLDFETTEHPGKLYFNEGNLYYAITNSGIYRMEVSSATLPSTPFFANSDLDVFTNINLNLFAIAVNDNKLHLTYGDYSSNGSLGIYDLNTNSELSTYPVGIIASNIYFN
jgi:YVTN family beta-propeller protein